eukprot:1895407-Pleurochrysis_carterae.AAC.4
MTRYEWSMSIENVYGGSVSINRRGLKGSPVRERVPLSDPNVNGGAPRAIDVRARGVSPGSRRRCAAPPRRLRLDAAGDDVRERIDAALHRPPVQLLHDFLHIPKSFCHMCDFYHSGLGWRRPRFIPAY